MEDLIKHAGQLGLRIKFTALGRRTAELHSSGLIYVNHERPLILQRAAVAHECGHWVHGHDWSRDHDQDRDERQADMYAARLLISAQAYADAERVAGPHIGAIAKELCVPGRLVELWRDAYLRQVGVIRDVEEAS